MRINSAHQNNLKNIDLTTPENQLVLVTGLSGSGKSSLAMSVIGNEGYRYFLESLSAYNQQNGQLILTAEGDLPNNLSRGLKAKGHPIGSTCVSKRSYIYSQLLPEMRGEIRLII
jgi:excinuclease UvrABC ATPase subunit